MGAGVVVVTGVGLAVGFAVSLAVGLTVGFTVGLAVGFAVGVTNTLFVGAAVAFEVGAAFNEAVGFTVSVASTDVDSVGCAAESAANRDADAILAFSVAEAAGSGDCEGEVWIAPSATAVPCDWYATRDCGWQAEKLSAESTMRMVKRIGFVAFLFAGADIKHLLNPFIDCGCRNEG